MQDDRNEEKTAPSHQGSEFGTGFHSLRTALSETSRHVVTTDGQQKHVLCVHSMHKAKGRVAAHENDNLEPFFEPKHDTTVCQPAVAAGSRCCCGSFSSCCVQQGCDTKQ